MAKRRELGSSGLGIGSPSYAAPATRPSKAAPAKAKPTKSDNPLPAAFGETLAKLLNKCDKKHGVTYNFSTKGNSVSLHNLKFETGLVSEEQFMDLVAQAILQAAKKHPKHPLTIKLYHPEHRDFPMYQISL